MYFDHFSCLLKAEGRAEEWGHFTKISQHDLSIGAQDESWRRPELVWWVKSSSGNGWVSLFSKENSVRIKEKNPAEAHSELV